MINAYTIKDIEHINDIPHGIMVNRGIIISMLFSLLSLFVQLHNVEL